MLGLAFSHDVHAPSLGLAHDQHEGNGQQNAGNTHGQESRAPAIEGGNLGAYGFVPTGGTAVAIKHLNTTYMWDKVRVQGGAYGGSSSFDIFSRSFAFTSYRDPNLLDTIDNYDKAASFLRKPVSQQDLTRSIIGVIGTVDAYRLPDAKGFVSMVWELIGDSEAARQARREQILSATPRDFEALADALDAAVSTQEVTA